MRDPSVGFWSDLVRALFGTQEHAAYGVDEALRAVVVLESDKPEWGFVKGTRRWLTINISVSAVAGEFSSIAILNPVGSGVLVIVDRFQNTSTLANCQAMHVSAAAVPGTLTEAVVTTGRDTREYGPGFNPNHAARIVTARSVGGALGTACGNWPPPSSPQPGHITDSSEPIAILAPGSFVAMQAAVVGQLVSGFFLGRERPLFKGVRA